MRFLADAGISPKTIEHRRIAAAVGEQSDALVNRNVQVRSAVPAFPSSLRRGGAKRRGGVAEIDSFLTTPRPSAAPLLGEEGNGVATDLDVMGH